MFAVDVPSNGSGQTQNDIVRIVLSDDDRCSPDHPVLLAQRLPVGAPVLGELRNEYGSVTVASEEQSVKFFTVDAAPVMSLRLSGRDPCTLSVEVPAGIQVWGLGQCFTAPNGRVDWVGRRREVDSSGVQDKFKPYGHGLQDYVAGSEGYIQVPVLVVAGGPQPFAIVLDYVYRIEADFTTNPWSLRLGSAVPRSATFPVRLYVVRASTAVDVRRRVMDLLGRPPVPPRKALGMWVSEYGFETWQDVDRVLAGLRSGSFPVDGVVLDLYWFGGVGQPGVDHSEMGRLGWDISDEPQVDDPYFPDPSGTLARYRQQRVEIALIEESYVNTGTDTFTQLQALGNAFVRDASTGSLLRFAGLWLAPLGEVTMLDWTNPAVGEWIHRNRRKPFMVDYGVRVHWTDLGEPEIFSPNGAYQGVDLNGDGAVSDRHEDVTNLYNVLWHQSIDAGYQQDAADSHRRRLLLSRSGSAGIQRFGAAIWSGDTGSRMEVLVAHLHAQAHMSCSGIDYHGADVGGFRREALVSTGHLDELYTQWFANSAWFDVPLRPHVDNSRFYNERTVGTLDGPERNRVAPCEVGHRESNLDNLRTRYRLIPYYYSLAHRAARTGMPVFPPPGIVYPDEALRGIAHQRLVGEDVLVAVVAGHGEYARRVYLPAGTWYDFHNGQGLVSQGEWFAFIPEYRNGVFRLPVFVRAGAILPMMHVDAETIDSFGHRRDGTRYEDLVLRAYADDAAPSSFTVYEDDGDTTDAAVREILVEQRRDHDHVVTVHSAPPVDGLATVRPLIVELVSASAVSAVTVNGEPLAQLPGLSRTERGWTTVDSRTVRACIPDADVRRTFAFAFQIAGAARTTASLLLVCDRAFTEWREDIHARFLQPLQTIAGPLFDVKLDPSLTYQYMYPEPPEAQRNCPMWTLLLDGIEPNQEVRLVYEKRRGGAVVHANCTQLYRSSGPGGYVGELRGSLY